MFGIISKLVSPLTKNDKRINSLNLIDKIFVI